jgi:hypothetical protein
MTGDGDEVALAAHLDAQGAEAGLAAVERDALDGACYPLAS